MWGPGGTFVTRCYVFPRGMQCLYFQQQIQDFQGAANPNGSTNLLFCHIFKKKQNKKKNGMKMNNIKPGGGAHTSKISLSRSDIDFVKKIITHVPI